MSAVRLLSRARRSEFRLQPMEIGAPLNVSSAHIVTGTARSRWSWASYPTYRHSSSRYPAGKIEKKLWRTMTSCQFHSTGGLSYLLLPMTHLNLSSEKNLELLDVQHLLVQRGRVSLATRGLQPSVLA